MKTKLFTLSSVPSSVKNNTFSNKKVRRPKILFFLIAPLQIESNVFKQSSWGDICELQHCKSSILLSLHRKQVMLYVLSIESILIN